MRRITDDDVRVALTQKINLIQFEFIVFRWVKRNTMVNCQRNVAVGEKLDQVVDILER